MAITHDLKKEKIITTTEKELRASNKMPLHLSGWFSGLFCSFVHLVFQQAAFDFSVEEYQSS